MRDVKSRIGQHWHECELSGRLGDYASNSFDSNDTFEDV